MAQNKKTQIALLINSIKYFSFYYFTKMSPGFLVANMGQWSVKLGGTEVKCNGHGQRSSTKGMPLSQAPVVETVGGIYTGEKGKFSLIIAATTLSSTLNARRPIKSDIAFAKCKYSFKVYSHVTKFGPSQIIRLNG